MAHDNQSRDQQRRNSSDSEPQHPGGSPRQNQTQDQDDKDELDEDDDRDDDLREPGSANRRFNMG